MYLQCHIVDWAGDYAHDDKVILVDAWGGSKVNSSGNLEVVHTVAERNHSHFVQRVYARISMPVWHFE